MKKLLSLLLALVMLFSLAACTASGKDEAHGGPVLPDRVHPCPYDGEGRRV